jgi:O-antigen/teichoic acid export membrane protein
MTAGGDLKRRTLVSLAWSFLRTGGSSLISFLCFAVMARLIVPEQFGLFALALIVVGLARQAAPLGLGDAVMQAGGELGEQQADTAFWAVFGLTLAAGLLLAALAPLYAALMGEPRVAPVLQAMAMIIPLSGLGAVHTARLLRGFGHKAFALRHLAGVALGGAVGIAAAAAGLGTWSLVVQLLVTEATMTAAALLAYPWRPGMRLSLAAFLRLARYGVPLMLSGLVAGAQAQGEVTILARTLGIGANGIWRFTGRLTEFTVQTAVQPFTTVAIVTLAKLQGDAAAYRAAFLRLFGAGAAVLLPSVLGLMVVAPELVVLLFGAQWREGGELLQLLLLGALPMALGPFIATAMMAHGASGDGLRVSILSFLLTVLLFLLAAPHGLAALAVAVLVRQHVNLGHYLWRFWRRTGISPRAMIAAIAAPLGAAGIMAGTLWLLAPVLRAAGGGSAAGFVLLTVPCGVALYGLALLAFGRRFLRSNLWAVLPLLRAREAA